MSLRTRILLAVVLVTILSLGLSGLLATRVALQRLPDAIRAPGVIESNVPGREPGRVLPDGRTQDEAFVPPRRQFDDDDDDHDDDDNDHDDDDRFDDLWDDDDGPFRFGERFNPVVATEIREAQAWAAGLALLIALVVGTVLAVGIARPIDRLADVTRRFGRGERSLRAEPGGPIEVAQLARTFNDTADALEEERRRRDRLTSDVAHELRTPLAVLKAELEAIQDGVYTADQERTEGLLMRVNMLTRLVDDLRALSRAEEGALGLEKEPIDLHEQAARIVGAFSPRRSEVTLTLEGEKADALADPVRFTQMLENLISNALRHASTTVRVTVSNQAGGPTVWVDDDGPGVPEHERERVFERLYRLDEARQRDAGGSGLGLALTRALARAHGGEARALASPLGGARVELRLPGVGGDGRTDTGVNGD